MYLIFGVYPLLVWFINSITAHNLIAAKADLSSAQHSSAQACNHLFICTKLELFLGDGLAL